MDRVNVTLNFEKLKRHVTMKVKKNKVFKRILVLLVLISLIITQTIQLYAYQGTDSSGIEKSPYILSEFDNDVQANIESALDRFNMTSDEEGIDTLAIEALMLMDETQYSSNRYIVKCDESANLLELKSAVTGIYNAALDDKRLIENARNIRLKNISPEELADYPVISEYLEKQESAIANLNKAQTSQVKLSNISENENNEAFRIIELSQAVNSLTFVNELMDGIEGDIIFAQPDYELSLSGYDSISDANLNSEGGDLLYAEPELDLYDIDSNLAAAHQISRGDGVLIAVIDTGIDINHPDLSANLTEGYDFFNDVQISNDYTAGSDDTHGTHIAGIIAQVAPGAQIMPLKVFENGTAYTSDIIRAIEFAWQNGVDIVNCSWGSTDINEALEELIEQSDMTFVCAAGNNRTDIGEISIFPAAYGFSNTISVASVNSDLGLSYFSNYSTSSVDVAAWGKNILSTVPNGEYGIMGGTSIAAAYVAGAAALIGDALNIKDVLMQTSDKLSCLTSKVSDGNKINFYKAASGIVDNTVIDISPVEDEDDSWYRPLFSGVWELSGTGFNAVMNNPMTNAYTNTSTLSGSDDSDYYYLYPAVQDTYIMSTTGTTDTVGILYGLLVFLNQQPPVVYSTTTLATVDGGNGGGNFKMSGQLNHTNFSINLGTISQTIVWVRYVLEVKSNSTSASSYTLHIEKPLKVSLSIVD
jgi:subtilisin family serine protease